MSSRRARAAGWKLAALAARGLSAGASAHAQLCRARHTCHHEASLDLNVPSAWEGDAQVTERRGHPPASSLARRARARAGAEASPREGAQPSLRVPQRLTAVDGFTGTTRSSRLL